MRVVDLTDIDVHIIGEGAKGDKAQQLIDKTAALRQIGFCTPRRTVLAEGFFDGFFQQNDLGRSLRDIEPSDDLESRIREGQFSDEGGRVLQQVCSSYRNQPLAIRSSAAGDARGTGIYKSVFCENAVGQVMAAVKKVLASYWCGREYCAV